MIFYPILFASKVFTSHIPTIRTIDGSSMFITHAGHISTPKLSLTNTYFIHKGYLNLLSIVKLCDLGPHINFSPSSYVI